MSGGASEMSPRRPSVRVTVAGSPPPGLLHLDLVSSAACLRAAITLSPRAPTYAAGAPAEVSVDGELLLAGPIRAVEPLHRSQRRYLAEPLASQQLRGIDPGLVGPLAWPRGSSLAMAAEVMADLPNDVSYLPAVDLRWSTPRAPRRWALDSLFAAVAAAAGSGELGYTIAADGTAALGPIAALRRRSGVTLRTGETIMRRRGDRYLTPAVPVLYGMTVRVDGATLVCRHARVDARAGRYRSRLVLEAA